MELAPQRQRPDRLPRRAQGPAMPWLTRQPRIGDHVFRLRIRVVQAQRERVQHVGLARELEALAPGAADITRGHERWPGQNHAAPDQVGERVLEHGRVETDAIVPELLADTRVPGKALLRLERRVREAGEEQIVEGRRAEAGAGAPVDPCAGLFDHERKRAALGDRAAEDRKSTRLNSSHMSISYAV